MKHDETIPECDPEAFAARNPPRVPMFAVISGPQRERLDRILAMYAHLRRDNAPPSPRTITFSEWLDLMLDEEDEFMAFLEGYASSPENAAPEEIESLEAPENVFDEQVRAAEDLGL